MLEQNLLQAYVNDESQVVIVSGLFKGYGKSVDPDAIVIDLWDAVKLAEALVEISKEYGYGE